MSGKRLFAGDSVIFVRYNTSSDNISLKFELMECVGVLVQLLIITRGKTDGDCPLFLFSTRL